VILAHLSDVHVRWGPGSGGPWYRYANKRILGRLNMLVGRSHSEDILEAAVEDLRRDPPDHLALTGDVSNLSLDAEFIRARGILARAELPAERISLIPGNHDTYTCGAYRARSFERAFAGILGEGVVWPRVQRLGEVLVVSTTSSVPTPWFTAYGRMGAAQLEQVAGLLAASEARFKVVLVHHPPLEGDGRPDMLLRRNRDGARLIEVCRAGGADLILCGHTHRAFDWTVEGPRPLRIFCAGSTTKPPARLGDAATYNRYRVEDGRLVAVEVRGYDPGRGRFVVVAERPLG
jgi:3',5'-cyclic AMP phosphodiesterase CpdA